jgi:large conductance mechanosensitive channel
MAALGAVGGVVNGETYDFMKFISRGNVLDLAVGTILGGLFGKIVSSFVDDLVGPILSVISTHSLEDSFITIRRGEKALYRSIEEARHDGLDGAVIMRWGPFVQIVINFLIQGMCLYFVLRMVDQAKKVPEYVSGWTLT